MEAPRQAYREMTSPENRNILATINPKLWAAYQRSRARAEFFDFPEKLHRLEEAILMTAGLDGRAREDLRDAIRGSAPIATLTTATQTNGHLGRPERVQRL